MNKRDWWTTEAMLLYGGSFVKQLSTLALAADAFNLLKIKATWPGYWQEYERTGHQMEKDQIARNAQKAGKDV